MTSVFDEEICSVCKNHNTTLCNKQIAKRLEKNIEVEYCIDYEKDSNRITKYNEPLTVTAKRDYIDYFEV